MSSICSGLKNIVLGAGRACWRGVKQVGKAVLWVDERGQTLLVPSLLGMIEAYRQGDYSEVAFNFARFTKGAATIGVGILAVTSNAPAMPFIAVSSSFYGGNLLFTGSDAGYSRKIRKLGKDAANRFILENPTVLSRIFNPKISGKLQQYFFNGSEEVQKKLRFLLKVQEISSDVLFGLYATSACLFFAEFEGLISIGEEAIILGTVVSAAALRVIRSRWCSGQLKEIRAQYEQQLPPRELSRVIELSRSCVASPSLVGRFTPGDDSSSAPLQEDEDSSSEGSTPVHFQPVGRTDSSQSLPVIPVSGLSSSRLARVSEEPPRLPSSIHDIARLYQIADLIHSSPQV